MGEAHLDIISTQWLNDHLNDPVVRILDVTWYSNRNAYDDYAKEHIPGALYFDLFKDVQNTDHFPRNLPTDSVFEQAARAAGVNKDSHVIVYDAEGKGGFFLGARAWNNFRYFGQAKVSVLDGGFQKWKSDGFNTTTEIPQVNAGNFEVNANASMLTKFEFMKENLISKEAQVLDSRPSGGYQGNPTDKRSGHYPGAVNIPFPAQLLDSNSGTFKKADDLKSVLKSKNVDLTKPIVAMCNSGMTSCSLILALKLAGAQQVSLYQGGFTEWKSRAEESEIEQS